MEPDPWDETLDASKAGNACIQKTSISMNLTHIGWTRHSEDCLNLNIYAPQVSSLNCTITFYSIIIEIFVVFNFCTTRPAE